MRKPWRFSVSPLSKDFEIFTVIYRERSISRACESMGMDQGYISKLLKSLEEKLDMKLFIRHRSGVKPTPAADELARALTEMQDLWQQAKKGAFSGEEHLTIRIGAHQSLARTYFAQLISKLNTMQENVYIETLFAPSYEITRKVQKREIEIGLVVNPVRSKDLVIRKVTEERVELCSLDPEKENTTLFKNPQMMFLDKLLQNTNFKKVIDIADYDVAAAICEQNESFSCLIPSTVRERYANLRVASALKKGVEVKLITYPGSPSVGWLAELAKACF